MTKAQLLILLLIIALAFYLSETKQPKNNHSNNFKKPPKPHPTKPTPIINLPDEIKLPTPKIKELLNQGWPAHFPSAQWVEEPPEPTQFKGLNPPHSQVDEPWEPSEPIKPTKTPEPTIKLPPPEPQPTKAPLNCPSDPSVPDPKNIQPTEPPSELTSEEQIQRKAQELSDYHWLLNHKTIADWQQEQKLTSPQFQLLRHLVNQEEMNTLNYFLNLLPTNYEWLLLSSEFKTQPSLIAQWKQHFTYQQTQDWLKIGLQPTDYVLAAWLKNTKNLTAEQTLNFADLEKLKEEFAHGN